MFVFWYCHKRGKQVRLDRETEASKAAEAGEKEESGGSDFDASDSEEGEVDDAAAKIAAAVKNDRSEKSDILNQPEPAQVPLPDADKGEKRAALEAEKAVGV